MDMERAVSKLGVMLVALALALASLSGLAVAGDEGCVTCHAGPMALNETLAKVENHPDVGAMVNTIPADCGMCHAKGTEMALMESIHAKHEGVDCANCHTMDADSGMPSGTKSGAKNW